MPVTSTGPFRENLRQTSGCRRRLRRSDVAVARLSSPLARFTSTPRARNRAPTYGQYARPPSHVRNNRGSDIYSPATCNVFARRNIRTGTIYTSAGVGRTRIVNVGKNVIIICDINYERPRRASQRSRTRRRRISIVAQLSVERRGTAFTRCKLSLMDDSSCCRFERRADTR